MNSLNRHSGDRRYNTTGLAILLILALAGTYVFAKNPQDTASVTVITSSGQEIPFTVEIARTPEEQAYGLMFRKTVPQGTGMLFPVAPPQQVSFWMKNTPVPLDMLFIAESGKILRIAANAPPQSLEAISSDGVVAWVLEITGGEAGRLGIKINDRLEIMDDGKTAIPHP